MCVRARAGVCICVCVRAGVCCSGDADVCKDTDPLSSTVIIMTIMSGL